MRSFFSNLATRLRRDQRGATAVEYGIMVSLIAVVIIVAVGLLGGKLNKTFTQVQCKISGGTTRRVPRRRRPGPVSTATQALRSVKNVWWRPRAATTLSSLEASTQEGGPPCPRHQNGVPSRWSSRSSRLSWSCCCWASRNSAVPTTSRSPFPARPAKASGSWRSATMPTAARTAAKNAPLQCKPALTDANITFSPATCIPGAQSDPHDQVHLSTMTGIAGPFAMEGKGVMLCGG